MNVARQIRISPAGAYGATKRYKSLQRLHKVNDETIIGAGGEISDFQYLQEQLDDLVTDDFCADDGIKLRPKEIFSWLSRVLYNRRNKSVLPPSPSEGPLSIGLPSPAPLALCRRTIQASQALKTHSP